ncbi:MAG: response regulator, partial [Candidatus Aminicenantes bacterium]|nr:response regulator [Candidatus Aminicenantes bacterium]
MDKKVRVLYIDDNEFDRELVRHSLESEENNFELIEASNQTEFKTLLDEGGYDLVLSDFNILGYKGLQVIEEVQKKYPGLPVILVTGTGSEEIAVDVLKKGAVDYVIKTPNHIKRLPQTIKIAFEKKELEEKNREAEDALRKGEEQYRGVFEAATDSFLVFNLNGEIVEANPAACKIYGYPYEELIGLTGKDIVHSDYYNEFKNFKEAVL